VAIIKGLEEWRPECEGAAYPLQLITDHKNLEYFMTKKLLNRRQARWTEFLTLFDHEIVYRPGKPNGKADALTRRPGDLPEGGDERLKNMEQAQNLLRELRLLADSPPAQGRPSIPDLMTEAYETDPVPGKMPEAICPNGSVKDNMVAECTKQDGRIQYRGKHYVLESDQLRLGMIQEHHDTALAELPVKAKTFDLLDRQYYWKEMRTQVDQVVRNCHHCQRSRSSQHSMFGVL